MSHVQEISLKILSYSSQSDTCLLFTNCDQLEVLNMDFNIESFDHFYHIIYNYFNSFRDLTLPKVYKYSNNNQSSSSSSDNYGGP